MTERTSPAVAQSAILAGLLLAAACLATSPIAAGDKPASGGYTHSLFDGESLNGWTVENGCEVAVQDGMLLLKAGNGWLRSDSMYGDFHLHVECKALQQDNCDAGIYIRTLPGGNPFPKRAYQVNLLQGKEGNIGNLPGATSTGLAKPAGEWNTFDITVVDDTVAVAINGKPAYRTGGLKIPRGHVGLQIEVPKGGQFLVRKLIVTEFGYESLFNGRDLTGWEGAGGPAEACWKVENGEIHCTGEKGPWLRSDREFADFNLRFDYQVSSGGNSGVYVRVPKNGLHHRKDDSLPPAGFEVQILDDSAEKYRNLKPYQFCGSVYDIEGANQHVSKRPGEWNTLEINCRGRRITTIHNGVTIVEADADEHPLLQLRQLEGHLGLQNHSTLVKFRHLRIGPAFE